MRDRWRHYRLPAGLSGLAIMALGGVAEARAQEVADFDIERAFLADSTIYAPFRVEASLPLSEALEKGRLDDRTSLLVMEHPGAGRLALVTDQMAYHHVAQGRIAGEPWLVSF